MNVNVIVLSRIFLLYPIVKYAKSLQVSKFEELVLD